MDPLDALDFRGQRALVTGGTRGIGAAIARHLAARGALVFLNYSRDDSAAEATCRGIVADGGRAEIARANLLQPAEVRELVTRIGAGGPLDILVHCAALGSFKPTVDVTPPQWDLTMSIGTRALLIAAQAAAPLMHGRGRIVSVSSLGGVRVMPYYGAIGIAKAALESLTRYLAYELAPQGIRVNAVAAGLIDGTSVAHSPVFTQLRDAALQRTPAGGLGTPDDVANAVLWLCSPLTDWIVGQILVVDGGASLLV
jgi:enoyl-[acyl-carrier protein] reductase III